MLRWILASYIPWSAYVFLIDDEIHSASVALCNSVSEYLNAQNQVPRPDELAALLPMVSEINQEVRALTSLQDGRAGRDYMDVAPYYPWLPGNSTSCMWRFL